MNLENRKRLMDLRECTCGCRGKELVREFGVVMYKYGYIPNG